MESALNQFFSTKVSIGTFCLEPRSDVRFQNSVAGVISISRIWTIVPRGKLGIDFSTSNQSQARLSGVDPELSAILSEFFTSDSGQPKSGSYAIDYFFYVLLSVSFGAICVSITYYISPYAIGSGIPEVKF